MARPIKYLTEEERETARRELNRIASRKYSSTHQEQRKQYYQENKEFLKQRSIERYYANKTLREFLVPNLVPQSDE